MSPAQRLGTELCKAWGIDSQDCTRIEVIFDASDGLPYACIHVLLNEQVIKTLWDLRVVDR